MKEKKQETPHIAMAVKEINMSPDEALTLALKALKNRNIKMWDDYRIVMNRTSDKSQWCISFISLPETPGMELSVFVENSGRTSLLPGR
jgi:hypothetical protein